MVKKEALEDGQVPLEDGQVEAKPIGVADVVEVKPIEDGKVVAAMPMEEVEEIENNCESDSSTDEESSEDSTSDSSTRCWVDLRAVPEKKQAARFSSQEHVQTRPSESNAACPSRFVEL